MSGRRETRALAIGIALAALGLCPAAAQAQVFIASKPHPDFWIAPLLITANIAPKDSRDHRALREAAYDRLADTLAACIDPRVLRELGGT